MADRTLTVKIIGDSRSLERAFDRSQKSAKGFQAQVVGVNRGMSGLAKATGATVGLAVFFDQARRSTQAASNLNEQINKSAVVFGQSSDSVLRWSRTTADAFGVSQRAALEAASGFGQILETSGLTEKRAASMSRSLVELAADIASFNNIDPAEALDKLRSGLAGEAEPLRRVGVLLSEARVKTEAYRSGIAKAGAKLTEGQKVQARYNLILKDTATAQGDFARTSGSLANKQRILSARVEELQARIGKDLVPVLSSLIDKLLAGEDAAHRLANALNSLPGGTSFRLKDLFPSSGVSTDAINELKRQSNLLDAVARGGATDQRLERAAKQAEKADRAIKLSAKLRNTIFDQAIARKLDRVQDVRTLQGQIAALGKIANLIERRIKVTKDITRKLNLEDAVVDIRRRQRGLRAEIAANQLEAQRLAEERRRERIEREREAAARRLAAIKSRQFRALGLAADGSEVVPGVRNLRTQLGNFEKAVSGTFLDTRKTDSIIKRIRKVLSGGLGAVSRDVRSTIADMLADLRNQLKDNEQQITRGRAVSSNAILSGLGLDRNTRKQLEARLARVGAGGKVLAGAGAGHPSAFGVAVPNAVIHNTISLDGQKIGQSTTRVQQKRKRRQSSQTTGPFAGQ